MGPEKDKRAQDIRDAFFEEKFQDFRPRRELRDYKDMSTEELIKAQEEIRKEIFRRLGS